MLERMPLSKLEDLKAGETIVVSSTKGAKSNEVTAITRCWLMRITFCE